MTPKANTSAADFSDIINPEDFKSVRLHIGINNLSTRTKFRDGKRSYEKGEAPKKEQPQDLVVQIVEFQTDALVLDTPPKVCAEGHMLLIDIKTEGAKPKDVMFEATGTVTSSQTLSNGNEQILFTFTQYNVDEWNRFQEVYSSRQAEILEFFKAVKD